MISVTITLTVAGSDQSTFSLLSNTDGFTTPFETGVTKAALEGGYLSTVVPDGTITIRVQSEGPLCTNFIDLPISGLPTTTTTTTESPTTTTTTTLPLISYEIQTYNCITCEFIETVYIDNTPVLTVGQYYYLDNGTAGLIIGQSTETPTDPTIEVANFTPNATCVGTCP
jgi:hypothetical protein